MKMTTLGDVAEWGSGGTPKRSIARYFGGGVPWLSIADLNDGLIDDSKESLTDEGLASSSAKLVPEGSIFIAMYGSIGKLGVAARPMSTSQAIAFARPKGDVVDQRYLFNYLLSQRPHLQARGRGGTQMNIGQGDLKAWPIPLPTLDEQRRIAAILDQADALRAKRLQVLAHLDNLTQSIFHDMFGDPDEYPTKAPFGGVASLAGGRNLVADDSSADSEFRVLKISAVTTGRFKPWEAKALPHEYVPPEEHLVRKGDLLMSRANTTDLVGAVALVDSDPSGLVLPDKVWRFVWHDPQSEPVFFHALMSTPSIRRRISRLSSGTGGSMKNVSKAKLNLMPVPQVDVSLQRTFVDTVSAASRVYRGQQQAANYFDELFASLQARAFRGEL